MKITGSAVSMASAHQETSYTYKETKTMEASASQNLTAAIVSISGSESASYMESMELYEKQQKEADEQRQRENEARIAQRLVDEVRESNNQKSGKLEMSDAYKMKLEMLKRMFEMLKQGKELSKKDFKSIDFSADNVLDLRASASWEKTGVLKAATGTMSVGTTSSGSVWERVTATSGFTSESECTTFATKGLVQTEDGRSIDFNVEVSMSRAFTSEFNTLETQKYIKTDPLMINLDTNAGTVSDQKFYFDLDADGKEEQISFAGKGSGFLALDKDGNGKIDDGSELFGTKSGDGFRDLAEYDTDQNGWIDENDAIFSRLKVWTKDENDEDILLDLKQADVGAICLQNADTQFSLKNDAHELNAEIKKTGIYLKESSGAVGTLHHVDLVI